VPRRGPEPGSFAYIQERIVQFFEQFLSGDQHPSHLFLFLRKPRQIAQFMPQGAISFCFHESCCGHEFVICREDFKKLTKTPALDISSEFLSFTLTLPAASSTRYTLPVLHVSFPQPTSVHCHGARRCRTRRWSPLQVPARYRCG